MSDEAAGLLSSPDKKLRLKKKKPPQSLTLNATITQQNQSAPINIDEVISRVIVFKVSSGENLLVNNSSDCLFILVYVEKSDFSVWQSGWNSAELMRHSLMFAHLFIVPCSFLHSASANTDEERSAGNGEAASSPHPPQAPPNTTEGQQNYTPPALTHDAIWNLVSVDPPDS